MALEDEKKITLTQDEKGISRRKFLKATAVAGGLAAARAAQASEGRGVAIITNPDDSLIKEPTVGWAARELEQSLTSRGIEVHSHGKIQQAAAADFCVVVAGAHSHQGRKILRGAGVMFPEKPESLALVPGKTDGRKVLLISGTDPRGLTYALLEAADRIHFAKSPLAEINLQSPIVEQPVNVIRAADRCFSSSVQDKPWYNDRSLWPQYLTMLNTARFNRFTLSFGLGYDYPQKVKDAYFYFTYPFLVSVPGYNVRAVGLPDSERDHNLEMLRYISTETAARGMDFQLGLWNHGYQWPKGSDANYTIAGLTPKTHAPYCRDALYTVLKACPGINGVVLRVHGESGIPEQDFAFWQTLLEGVVKTGRRIEINLHAKGMTQKMINIALATHLPVTLSPKYWAEHCGLPYQPASIRKKEMPPLHPVKKGFFDLSEGSRRFLRYSYGDLLKRDRPYGVIFRIWPGTQRCLLWGDPVMTPGDAQAGQFCGSLGIDLFEPLTFKGRHGSGLPGGRCAYEDDSLKPRYDFEKFEYSYRIWGRNLYNPKTDPDGWRRLMKKQMGAAAPSATKALANASRILRVVTAARGPSAANNTYWPEMYTNMPIVDASEEHLYDFDTLPPRVFNNVSSFDPEMFLQINEFADEMLKGHRSGKYSPLEVAQWLEDYAHAATAYLAEAKKRVGNPRAPEFRRLAVDVSIQVGIGRFFAWKTRSGVLYQIYEQTGDRRALHQAITAYRTARNHWLEAASYAKDVYMKDITYGIEKHLRGTWADRVPAFDSDIEDMESRLKQQKQVTTIGAENVRQAIHEALSRPSRPWVRCHHTAPAHFEPGRPMGISLSVEETNKQPHPTLIRLTYRHVNQGEYYQTQEMQAQGRHFHAVIPAAYTQSPFELQYFFVLHAGPDKAWIYPGIGRTLSNQPYYVVEQKA